MPLLLHVNGQPKGGKSRQGSLPEKRVSPQPSPRATARDRLWLDMASQRPAPVARQESPGWKGRAVPRPVEKWLAGLAKRDWTMHPVPPWLEKGNRIALDLGCTLAYDPSHHYRESAYLPWANVYGLCTVLLGGAGATEKVALSVLAHELGHHLLMLRGQDPYEKTLGEEAAWALAHELAERHGLPICPRTKKWALYSYRYRELLDATVGSQQRTRPERPPKSERLKATRRGAGAKVPKAGEFFHPVGDKGKVKLKKEVKRSTVRAERRNRVPAD